MSIIKQILDGLMESQSSEKRILENAQEIYQSFTQIGKFTIKRIIHTTCSQSYQSFKQILQQKIIQNIFQYTSYGNQINIGKQNLEVIQDNKQPSNYILICFIIHYNLGCSYQGQWNLKECQKYLQNAINFLHILLSIQNLKIDQFIVRKKLLILCNMQYCAIVSQNGKQIIIIDIKNPNYTPGMPSNSQKNYAANYYNSQHKNNNQQIIDFGQKIIKKTEFMLNQFYNMSMYQEEQEILLQQTLKNVQRFDQVKNIIYNWKKNIDNNEKQMRRQFSLSQFCKKYQDRTLLGIKIRKSWLNNFNIGSVMHMQFLKFRIINQADVFEEITQQQLIKLSLYLSICYFTLSTEIRFIKSEKQKIKKIIDDKHIKQLFQIPELLHLKALQIGFKYIRKINPYINHMITTYHKNYNNNLLIIVSILQKDQQNDSIQQTSLNYINDYQDNENNINHCIQSQNNYYTKHQIIYQNNIEKYVLRFSKQKKQKKISPIKKVFSQKSPLKSKKGSKNLFNSPKKQKNNKTPIIIQVQLKRKY